MMANNDPAGSMMSMMASGQPPVRASSTTPRYGTSTPGVLAVKFATEFRMPVSLPAAPRFAFDRDLRNDLSQRGLQSLPDDVSRHKVTRSLRSPPTSIRFASKPEW